MAQGFPRHPCGLSVGMNDPWPDDYSSTGWGNAPVSLLKEFKCNVLRAFNKKGHMCLYWG